MAVDITIIGNQAKIVNGTKTRYDNLDDLAANFTSDDKVIVFNNVTGKELVKEPFGDYNTPPGGSAVAVADAISSLLASKAGRAVGNTPDLTNVPANVASVLLKAENLLRKTLTIVNDGNSTLKIKYGTAATADSFTHELGAGDEIVIDDYTGIVHGIWNVANGDARITEVTE